MSAAPQHAHTQIKEGPQQEAVLGGTQGFLQASKLEEHIPRSESIGTKDRETTRNFLKTRENVLLHLKMPSKCLLSSGILLTIKQKE